MWLNEAQKWSKRIVEAKQTRSMKWNQYEFSWNKRIIMNLRFTWKFHISNEYGVEIPESRYPMPWAYNIRISFNCLLYQPSVSGFVGQFGFVLKRIAEYQSIYSWATTCIKLKNINQTDIFAMIIYCSPCHSKNKMRTTHVVADAETHFAALSELQ